MASTCVITSPLFAQTFLSCQQLGSVSQSALPTYSSASAEIQLLIGSHYWSCPCGEARHLVGDNENRQLVGDNEQRHLVGDSEQRHLVGDSEQRHLVGDSETRHLVGDSEQRHLVGDNEARHLVGDASGIQCHRDPSCAGFILSGADVPGIKVAARGGMRPVAGACVDPY